jgi:hypothetical protein
MMFRTQTAISGGINPGPIIPLSLESHKQTNGRWEDIATPLVSLGMLLLCMKGELVWLEMDGGWGHVQLEVNI